MKARKLVGGLMVLAVILYIPWCIHMLFFNKKEIHLEGKIDECCTSFNEIDAITHKIQPYLMSLVSTNFFRLFKVDLQAKCPFWALQAICKNPKSCGVCVCEDKDIPANWLAADKKTFSRGRLSDSQTDFFQESREPRKESEWGLGEIDSPTSVYVDLLKNHESYTGYQGQNVWNTIYRDNCFQEGACLEERLLSRAISGMHSSISTHLSEYYEDFELNMTYPNIDMWFDRVGNHPDRIKNLYFAFSITLRGLFIARDYLSSFNFSTGNFIDDFNALKTINEILQISQNYGDVPFDESLLFKDASKFALKDQLKDYFTNITRLMDCVECEKCKTFGKMQIAGLGTALKLIFDDKYKSQIQLSRNEIIALVNTLTKWATSIVLIPQMVERANEHNFEVVRVSSFMLILIIVVSKLLLVAHNQVVSKFKQRISTKSSPVEVN